MFNLNFNYDKLYLKEVLLLIPKNHQNILSLLTPVLGLYGINVKEFINALEDKIKYINYDIVIPVAVSISKIKTFEICLKTPTITSLLASFDNFTNNNVDVSFLSLYKIAIIKSHYLNFLDNNKLKIYYKMIRSYLKSLNRTLSYLLVYKKLKKTNFDCMLNLYNDNFFINKLLFFKKMSFVYNTIKSAASLKYALFFFFPGINNSKFNYIKNITSLYNLNCNKTLNSLFIKDFFFSFNVCIFSHVLCNMYKFYKDITIDSKNQFLLYFCKINCNLCSVVFFKKYLSTFIEYNSKNISFLFCRLLHIKTAAFLKHINNAVFSMLFLLKSLNNNANISSNY